MTSKKPETLICDKIRHWVATMGGYAIHTSGSIKQANQPDILGGLPTDTGFIQFQVEVKIPGKNARPAQDAMLDVWQSKAGFLVGVVHSLEEFIDLIYKERYRRGVEHEGHKKGIKG
jgi:hypothetical protein